jgi:hypothetical protein
MTSPFGARRTKRKIQTEDPRHDSREKTGAQVD